LTTRRSTCRRDIPGRLNQPSTWCASRKKKKKRNASADRGPATARPGPPPPPTRIVILITSPRMRRGSRYRNSIDGLGLLDCWFPVPTEINHDLAKWNPVFGKDLALFQNVAGGILCSRRRSVDPPEGENEHLIVCAAAWVVDFATSPRRALVRRWPMPRGNYLAAEGRIRGAQIASCGKALVRDDGEHAERRTIPCLPATPWTDQNTPDSRPKRYAN